MGIAATCGLGVGGAGGAEVIAGAGVEDAICGDGGGNAAPDEVAAVVKGALSSNSKKLRASSTDWSRGATGGDAAVVDMM